MVTNTLDMVGARVLVVEDNDVNQTMIREMLRMHGLTVVIVDNGEEAVRILSPSDHGFSLVFMDIRMPVMDGYEATQQIRKLEHNRDLPIIALSADQLQVGDERYLEVGMNDYLEKPLHIKRLRERLKEWIKPLQSENTPESWPAYPQKSEERLTRTGSNLVGIDYEAALDRLQGNKKLLNQLLHRFVNNYSAAAGEVRQALSESDIEGAGRLLHTMKGMAGNLSATEIYEIVVDIEKRLPEGDSDTIQDLLKELEELFIILGSNLSDVTGVVPTMVLNEEEHKRQYASQYEAELQRLAVLLKHRNISAEEAYSDLVQKLPASLLDDELQTLTVLIERMQFRQVFESLPLLAKKLDVSYSSNNKVDISQLSTVERVLIVDDVADNIRVLATMLSPARYEIYVATRGEKALEQVKRIPPDLILLDVNMPDMDGHEVCRQLKGDPDTQSIPIIFVTSASDETEEAYGLELGAADYIQKPTHPAIVRARVKNHILLKQQKDQLLRLSIIDGLTGIANRRRFNEVFPPELERTQRQSQPLSLIMCDIDHFKQYNDHYGHQAGDDCLMRVAQMLAAKLQRAGDFVARYGGEEFVIILPATDEQAALLIAERMRNTLETECIEHAGHTHGFVSMSFGVSTRLPESELTKEQLLRNADEALYLAKGNGRNRVEVYKGHL